MLFPYLSSVRANDRATEFGQRCRQLGISGVTLHSYRYAWAERATDLRLPGKIRAGGSRAQQQGRASGLCEAGLDENPVAGGLRAKASMDAADGKTTSLRMKEAEEQIFRCHGHGEALVCGIVVYGISSIAAGQPIRRRQIRILLQRPARRSRRP